MAAAVDVDGPIAWRRAGPPDGEHVALLHGLGGSRTAWCPQLVALAAAGFDAAAWDMPGYGASAPIEPLTFEALVGAVERWLDALGAESAHIVGLSFGGMIAQHVALHMSDRVRSLTLLDTSPAFGLDGSSTATDWLELRLRPLSAGETPATLAPAVLRSIMADSVSETTLQEAIAAMERIPSTGLAAAARCLVTHDLRGRLHEIVAPTLVIVGEHDYETPLSYSTYLADHITEARLAVVTGAGHISNLEQPDQVNRLLRDFLAANTR
ncbi:MAG TPA: alpha/beta fold hydrolase [Ilumatobacter sp.]|nr:alpha/beta fold hydrolase [Ilumatobacter sp.]